MQSLNNFTTFQLNSEETINVNGGRGRGRGNRLARRTRRFGKQNRQLLDGTTMETTTNYTNYDFAGFGETATEEETQRIAQPEQTSNDLSPEFVIF